MKPQKCLITKFQDNPKESIIIMKLYHMVMVTNRVNYAKHDPTRHAVHGPVLYPTQHYAMLNAKRLKNSPLILTSLVFPSFTETEKCSSISLTISSISSVGALVGSSFFLMLPSLKAASSAGWSSTEYWVPSG